MDNHVSDFDSLKLYRVVINRDVTQLDPADYDAYLDDFDKQKKANPNNWRYQKPPMSAQEWIDDQFFKAELEGYTSRFWTTKGVATTYANRVKKNTKINAWVESGTVTWSKA